MKDKIFETTKALINVLFAIAALTFLAPLLPGVEFHGGLLTAVFLGSVFYGYQRLWMRLSGKLMGLAQGSCPMPGMMKWVMLSCTAGIVIFIGALGLFIPAVYAVHGIIAALAAGVVTLLGMTLSNLAIWPVRKLAGK